MLLGQFSFAVDGVMLAPTRAELSATKKIETFTLTNNDKATKLMQVEVYLWQQQDNQNVLTPTKDILVTPPIFKLQSGQYQVVRTFFKPPVTGTLEQSYRVIFKEIAHLDEANKNNAVTVLINMSVPVFISKNNKASDQLTATELSQLKTQLSAGLSASVKQTPNQPTSMSIVNNNQTHVQILRASALVDNGTEITLPDITGSILPMASHRWALSVALPANVRQIKLNTTRGDLIVSLAQF